MYQLDELLREDGRYHCPFCPFSTQLPNKIGQHLEKHPEEEAEEEPQAEEAGEENE